MEKYNGTIVGVPQSSMPYFVVNTNHWSQRMLIRPQECLLKDIGVGDKIKIQYRTTRSSGLWYIVEHDCLPSLPKTERNGE